VILAIDQGTTGTTCLVVDGELRVRGRGYREFPQHYPQPGWVEHDPDELWGSSLGAAEDAVRAADMSPSELEAIGITNQRETTILWQRATGRPVAPAIVWQDRRTAERCRGLPAELLRARTGLVPDPYFSATKLEWLLARTDVPRSELAFGTVDSWLVWRLTGGRVHVTDLTNASRTMLLDLDTLDWSDELLDLFGVDRALLPRLARSSEIVGEADLLGVTLPIAGIAGDQQAALFGHGCFDRGQAKATYGTGSFVLAHAGAERGPAPSGLLETVAASGGFALEGAILASGAAIQWLRDELGILSDAAESERLASSVESTGGVSFVPAFAGLGSPHWNADARGTISGITRGTTRAQLVRAALEGIAFQVADVLDLLPGGVDVLRADGGASANGFLMQFQADLLGCPVEVAGEQETTALGAAALAGRAVGIWPDDAAIRQQLGRGAVYEPAADRDWAAARRAEWRAAVDRALL
jgi:glycerol kinase